MGSFDAGEQSVLEPAELDQWDSVSDVAQEIERYQRYAQAQAAVKVVGSKSVGKINHLVEAELRATVARTDAL